MIETLVTVALLLEPMGFPLHFDAGQRQLSQQIIHQAHLLNEDPYTLMALAWKESKLKRGRTSKTGDVGIFQINWSFWGKRVWKYKSFAQFKKDMDDPIHATLAAVMVLREFRLYKTCRGMNLYACYNGGPAWQKSKNVGKIMIYAKHVHRYRTLFKRKYQSWAKKKEEGK